MLRVEKPQVDKLVALKSPALSISKISPEFLIDQNRVLLVLSYTFSQYLITYFQRELSIILFVCLFVWCLTTHQPLWVISVRRY